MLQGIVDFFNNLLHAIHCKPLRDKNFRYVNNDVDIDELIENDNGEYPEMDLTQFNNCRI